nr:MAG TPA: hypothetical protein [Microviridae sp.]
MPSRPQNSVISSQRLISLLWSLMPVRPRKTAPGRNICLTLLISVRLKTYRLPV